MTDQPAPPTEVYWVVPAGSPFHDVLNIPAPLQYDGTSEYGYTQWSVPFPTEVREGMYLHIGWMWAKHAIVVRAKGQG